MLLFRTSKIEGPVLSFCLRYRCLCCSKSKNIWESKPYRRCKILSALINDLENNIAYWVEAKQSEALAGKRDLSHTVNCW